jgi:secretion/DNA translocation related CpaE-like protein
MTTRSIGSIHHPQPATGVAATPAPATPSAAATRPRLPLVLTADDELLDELLRLAAAAGTDVEVASDPAAARGRFTAAPLVLVGADQVPACLRARLPRRTEVVVVGPDRSGAAGRPGGATAGPAAADPPAELWGLAEQLGAAHVAILPAAQPWLVERFAGSQGTGSPARVVAVLGGRGGAGASVLAAGLAVTAAALGRPVLLVDADPLGGGLDLVLGWEDDQGVRWPELAGSSGRLDAVALVGALPARGDLALLSFDRRELGPVPPEAMTAVLAAGRHARELVVVDLPRPLDPAAVVALQAADDGLLLVPAEIRAVTAAARVAGAAADHCARLRLVVRGPSPGRLTAGEISSSLRLPVAGTLRPELGLPATLEGGLAPTATGRGPLAVLCRRLVDELCGPVGAVRQ